MVTLVGVSPSSTDQGSSDMLAGVSIESESELDRGYIKLWRKLQDDPKADDPAYLSVWIHLLIRATHKEMKIVWCGKPMILKPGQLVMGRRKLAAITGLTEMRIRRILKYMKMNQQINQQTSNRSSIITIINWKLYQVSNQQDNQQATSKQPTDNQQTTTNKNVKNVKNVKNEESSLVHFDRFLEAYPRKENKAKAKEAWIKKNLDGKIDIILEAIKKWKATDQWKRDGGKFIPHPTTWLNGERWDDEVQKPKRSVGYQDPPKEWFDE